MSLPQVRPKVVRARHEYRPAWALLRVAHHGPASASSGVPIGVGVGPLMLALHHLEGDPRGPDRVELIQNLDHPPVGGVRINLHGRNQLWVGRDV